MGGEERFRSPQTLLFELFEAGDRDRELSSLVVKAKGSRRENGYELTLCQGLC